MDTTTPCGPSTPAPPSSGSTIFDLYLLHWPWPANWSQTVAAYQAAERLLAEGRVRAIGVANFKSEHLRALVAQTEVVPAVNQVELHPNFQQPEQVALHHELGIVTQAWSPIGGVYRWAGENGAVPPLRRTVEADTEETTPRRVASAARSGQDHRASGTLVSAGSSHAKALTSAT